MTVARGWGFWWGWNASRRWWPSDYALVRTEGWNVPDSPRVVRDFHIMRLDYESDVARFRMTRAALGHPGKVRVEIKTGGEQQDGDIVRDWLQHRRDFTAWVKRG